MTASAQEAALRASGGKARLLTLDDLDGRTLAARRCKEAIQELESDLGGADAMSAAERGMARDAALLATLIEHAGASWLEGGPIDTGALATLINARRRVVETLGLKRRARDVTPPNLKSYLKAREAA